LTEKISIIYANRNRDSKRIKVSLDYLDNQSSRNFEVVFIDYGSNKELLEDYRELFEDYNFVRPYFLDVKQLLWNKSKALNYGIKQAYFSYVFIADVDLVFHPGTIQLLDDIKDPQRFHLFKLGYLSKDESNKLGVNYHFDKLKPARFGDVNGMILVFKGALMDINGYDEFFHFYGAEDEDLFSRLQNGGYKKELNEITYFYHNWHKSFSDTEDKLLTGNPRIKNIMRINQRHFHQNRDKGIIKPLRQKGMGEVIDLDIPLIIEKPDAILKIPNILAQVEHLLKEELSSFKDKIIRMEFFEDPYYSSFKHRLKKILRKQTQPYISMKEVNDMVLKEILYHYRDHNYSYEISKDLKSIVFCVQL